FIPADAPRPGVEPDLHDVAHPALRHPRRTGIIVQVGNVKGRLVALRILPDQARHVRELSLEEVLGTASPKRFRSTTKSLELVLKQGVQLGHKLVSSTYQVDQASHILLDVEGINPSVHFGVIFPSSLASAPYRAGFLLVEYPIAVLRLG